VGVDCAASVGALVGMATGASVGALVSMTSVVSVGAELESARGCAGQAESHAALVGSARGSFFSGTSVSGSWGDLWHLGGRLVSAGALVRVASCVSVGAGRRGLGCAHEAES
jgi:hypothetical protein